MLHFSIEIQKDQFTLNAQAHFSFEQITVVMGKSGAGKTTLLRALAGLDKARGVIKFGESVWQDDRIFLKAHQRPIGFIFQEAYLFPHLNVQENIEYGAKRIKNKTEPFAMETAIELMQIGALLKREVHHLSGGEKQRVALARSLATNPKVLLMDEPLSAIDFNLKQTILEYIIKIQSQLKIPIIYVTHAMDEIIKLAHDAVYLENGRLLASDKIESILTRFDLNLAFNPNAESIITAEMTQFDDRYNLTLFKFEGSILHLVGRHQNKRGTVKLRIQAKDVSITKTHQKETSILNIFPAKIKEVADGNDAQKVVQLEIGTQIILGQITRKSFDLLNLEINQSVFIQIKSMALVS